MSRMHSGRQHFMIFWKAGGGTPQRPLLASQRAVHSVALCARMSFRGDKSPGHFNCSETEGLQSSKKNDLHPTTCFLQSHRLVSGSKTRKPLPTDTAGKGGNSGPA